MGTECAFRSPLEAVADRDARERARVGVLVLLVERLGEPRIEPGSHVVRAQLPDGRVVARTLEARAGDVYVVFP